MSDAALTKEAFQELLKEVTSSIEGRALDASLQADLNARFPPYGERFEAIFSACKRAIGDGWMCAREAGGIRYGRVIKPAAELSGYSVDVVEMDSLRGPHHRHPNGEIDMIMPLTPEAKFDGHPAGWLVYGPESAHSPTVSGGRALILYLLPRGAIEFSVHQV